MARGGYRPGAGAKKGAPRRKRGSGKEKPGDLPLEVVACAKLENLTPLEFMLKHMNDPSHPLEFRARMAQAAAPFCHARAGEKGGKKGEQAEAASRAANRFAPAPGPNVFPLIKQKVGG